MDKEKQRIKIAEVCGYTHVRIVKAIEGPPDIGIGHHPTEPHSVPDYLNDLNAMHKAIRILTDAQRIIFRTHLTKVWTWNYNSRCGSFPNHDDSCNATAEQRAEAFLRTLDLWEE
jgi:hypothetical protein